MTPEKAKAAWALEAAGVANRIGATKDQSAKVVDAYVQAREGYERDFEKLRQDQVRRARAARDAALSNGKSPDLDGLLTEMSTGFDQLKASSREKLQNAVSRTLSTEQAADAVVSLGIFSRDWDLMADAVGSFGLEDAKQQQALEAVERFQVDFEKTDPIAIHGIRGGSDNGKVMQTARQELRQQREKLNDSMKKIVSSEQFVKFEAAQHADKRDRWLPTP